MYIIRGFLVAGFLVAGFVVSLSSLAKQADGQKMREMILGKWKMEAKTDSGEIYSMTVEFFKEGKLKVLEKIGDGERLSDGKYKLAEERVLDWEYGDKDVTKERQRIDTLTETKLSLSTGDEAVRTVLEFQRVK